MSVGERHRPQILPAIVAGSAILTLLANLAGLLVDCMTRLDAARLIAINTVVSLALAAGVAAWMQRTQKPTFGTLDVAELYRLKEAQVAAVLVKRDSGDAERILAIQRAAIFGAELSKLIDTLPEECGCLVLTRGAVLGTGANLIDLTPDVRRRLGL